MNQTKTAIIAVLISGQGSNLKAIIEQQSKYNYQIGLVISNKANAGGLQVAKDANIKTAVIEHQNFPTREEFDNQLKTNIDANNIDFVILAGFMRILTQAFTEHYLGRMINIHPSLLPKYKGLNTHQKALEAKDKIHGVSIHFVTPELDGGPVILQAQVKITQHDTVDSLAQKVLEQEHQIYPLVCDWLSSKTVSLGKEGIIWRQQPLTKPIQFQDIKP